MSPTADGPTAGVVLAAGASSRLGRPKQLLPFGAGTLLDHTLGIARECGFDQLLCTLGGHARQVRSSVDLDGIEAVENADFGSGCASSIAAAMGALDPRCELLVLLLGDQPGVSAASVAALLSGRGEAPIAVCRYADGRGHPVAFAAPMFGELRALHGDRAIWKLLDRHRGLVAEVAIGGRCPRDIDTWQDYEALLAEAVGR